MKSVQNIEKKIQTLKAQLLELGPMRPGSLSPQYNVCGKAGCRCKDPQKEVDPILWTGKRRN